MKIFYSSILSFSLCLTAIHGQDSEAQPDQSTFKDPFSNETSEPVAPVNEPIPANPTPETSPDINEIPAPDTNPILPEGGPSGGGPLPVQEPEQKTEEQKNFEFPELDKDNGPVTQDIIEKQEMAAGRQKRWNIAGAFGIGVNMNRRHEQFHLEMSGGYRLTEKWELDGVLSYRNVKDQLIGFLALAKWIYPIKIWKDIPGEVLPYGGLGWSIRMKPSGSKFTEGRATIRLGGELNAYATPTFAITTALAIESFLFLIDNDTGSQSLFKNGGPPTQLLITFGGRWGF